jgi:hypothetical protein
VTTWQRICAFVIARRIAAEAAYEAAKGTENERYRHGVYETWRDIHEFLKLLAFQTSEKFEGERLQ